MRFRAVPAIAAVLLTAACSSTTATSSPAPTPSTPAASPSPSRTAAPASPSAAPSVVNAAGATGPKMAWGTRAYTVGSTHPFQAAASPGAPLEITPTTVVYATKTSGETPASGMFVVVVTKDQAPMAEAVATAPATGGGWTWIAPDGQAVSTMSGNASQVTVTGMNEDVTPAGAYILTTVVFDVPASAKGGILQYTDGGGTSYRWKTPAADSGPQLGQVQSALAQ